MPGIVDFLQALGGPAASVLHGYLGGQVGAEQYRQRLKAAQAEGNVKQQQIDIAKQHQKFLEDQAASKPLEDAKQRAADVLNKMQIAFQTDPKAQESLHARGPHAVADWENFYNGALAVINDPNADFKKLQELYKNPAFQHFDQMESQQSTQPGEPSVIPPGGITIPGAPTLDIPPELQKLGLIPSPVNEGTTIYPRRPQGSSTPTGPPVATDQFGYPLTQSQLEEQNKNKSLASYHSALAAQAGANTGLLGEKTTTERVMRNPKLEATQAETGLHKAQTLFTEEQKKYLGPTKVADIERKYAQTAHENATLRETISNNERKHQEELQKIQVSAERNAVLNDLNRAKTVLTAEQVGTLKQRADSLISKLPPALQAQAEGYKSHLYTYNQLTNEWVKNQDAADKLQALADQATKMESAKTGKDTNVSVSSGPTTINLKTNDTVRSGGTGPKVNQSRKGNFSATVGKSGGAPPVKTQQQKLPPTVAAPKKDVFTDPEAKKAYDDPKVRDKVTEEMGKGVPSFLAWAGTLPPSTRKIVQKIAKEQQTKLKVKPKE